MEEILVFGNGNISKIISNYLEKNYNIVAYVSLKKYISSKKFNNKPLYSIEKIKKIFSPKKYKFITAIGYLEMNSIRKNIHKHIKSKGYKFIIVLCALVLCALAVRARSRGRHGGTGGLLPAVRLARWTRRPGPIKREQTKGAGKNRTGPGQLP